MHPSSVTIPAAESFETGTLSTIYVQAAGGGANVSACAGQSFFVILPIATLCGHTLTSAVSITSGRIFRCGCCP